jgi:DNA-binding Lrp family transcriptional regulator
VSIREKETLHGGSTPKLSARVIKPFVADGPPSSTQRAAEAVSAPGPSLIGISPAFSEKDVAGIVKRDKAFIFFGSEEIVSSAQLIFRPMVELAVALRIGVLRKRIGMRYIVLDGATGMSVEFGDGPVMYSGLERVMGLTAEDIGVLRETSVDADMGVLEIADKIGVSRETLRRPLKLLEERRLIGSHRAGRSRLYRRVYDFPEFRWQESGQVLEQFSAAGKVEKNLLSEAKLGEAMKGLVPHSEIQEYKEFVYPLYRVELALGRKKRIVWLDGRTGKELRP